MPLEAVAWGISVAGWIMSPVISKLLDKVLSYCKSNKAETLRHLLTDVLPRLTLTLEAAEAINHSKLFEEMVRGLKSAFYDMEDILDELEYIRLQKKLDKQNSSKSKKKIDSCKDYCNKPDSFIVDDMEWSESANEVFFQKVFEKLRKLRVLALEYSWSKISGISALEIPPAIGQLKHLRHLALVLPDRSKLILPRTLTKLYHLQVLICDYDYDDYNKLEFPPDIHMGKLSNLRHMSTGCYGMTAPNIARLTSLQTLDYFKVGIEHGYEIRDLNKLQGCLSIEDLDNVKSKNEALEANLAAKTRLAGLKLAWIDGTRTSPEVEAEVLEGLCPPKGLKSLEIWGYEGLGYPSWMVDVQNGGPEYLNTLDLTECRQLVRAPELFECFIHLRKFTISESGWDYLPDNVKDLRWL